MHCPICAASTANFRPDLYDDRYGYPDQFALMRCKNCGHAFLGCDFTPDQLTALYTDYYPRKTFDLDQCKPHAEKSGSKAWLDGLDSSAFRWVPKNVRVLDVGCGFGQSLAYYAARGCDVYGVEADENIRRVVEKFGYKVHVGLFDDKIYEENFFDYVTMDQVLEHVTDPLSTLRGIGRILKPGGSAILSLPNANGWGAKTFGRHWINWHTPYHLQFFSRHSMQLAAQQAGLVVAEARTVTNSEWLYYQWIHLITYPNAGEPSSFWSPTQGGLSVLQRVALRLLGLMHKTKINHLITRLFDGLGWGDNFVFVLRKP